MSAPPELRIIGLGGIPEVQPGDDLAALIVRSLERQSLSLQADDVLVVTQKIVSKAEGRLVRLSDITPSPEAVMLAREVNKDPRQVELVLRESVRIVRKAPGVLITETRSGQICANAGVDASNVAGGDVVSLLPEDPDASAAELRRRIAILCRVEVALIITDTFGRPWREGQTNVAIGVAGMEPLHDYTGQFDSHGQELRVTSLAVADE
ncbi:MAG TPA: coenzyme F420-0:L-glutamate ligase, partial [Dehalococcoidia bacterium]|nr:coenzyme F420-0:L-glutamate ligase [Dehalococcoidia bacterium]